MFTAAPDAAAGANESRQLNELNAVDVAETERPGVLSRDVLVAAARATAVDLVEEDNVRGRHPGVAAEGTQLIIQPQAHLGVVRAENDLVLRGCLLMYEIRSLNAAIEMGRGTAPCAQPVAA